MANIQSGASILGGKYTLRKRVQRQVCKREEVDVRGMTACTFVKFVGEEVVRR